MADTPPTPTPPDWLARQPEAVKLILAAAYNPPGA